MQTQITTEYLSDDVWYVAHLNAAIPDGEDEELSRFEASIQDAYRLMIGAMEGSVPCN